MKICKTITQNQHEESIEFSGSNICCVPYRLVRHRSSYDKPKNANITAKVYTARPIMLYIASMDDAWGVDALEPHCMDEFLGEYLNNLRCDVAI